MSRTRNCCLRFLPLALLLPCLIGCRAAASGPQASLPPISKIEPWEEPPQTSTAASTEAADTELPSATETEIAASDPPSQFQFGDTTPTWRPELAAGYPADADCSAALLLEKWMAVEGLSADDLDARDCQQLVLVAAQPGDAAKTITVCYERTADGGFAQADGLPWMQGYVGKNGILHDRRRNTNTSPAGLWPLSFAFGNEPPPEGLKLPWRQVTSNSDWVCDETSVYFNTWQERGDPTLLTSWSEDVEHLEDYPRQYAYACVIEFNRPPDVVPHRGCAIFLHCSEGATGGCVGLAREDMLSVLKWLDPEKHPHILISGFQAEEED